MLTNLPFTVRTAGAESLRLDLDTAPARCRPSPQLYRHLQPDDNNRQVKGKGPLRIAALFTLLGIKPVRGGSYSCTIPPGALKIRSSTPLLGWRPLRRVREHLSHHRNPMRKTIMSMDQSKPILVTGATGYIAGWIIKRLLEEGFTVHATVRDPSNTQRVAYLYELSASLPGSIQLFEANLLSSGSFASAMKGCHTVFHVASPFILDIKDPEQELIRPAVEGTINVLEEANAQESVKQVILTSSCAAIYGDNADLQKTERGYFTEAHWNNSSSPTYVPYSYSKAVAEREAWRIADAQSRWKLVAINPSQVYGPGVRMHAESECFRILTQLGDGTLALGAPDLGIGVVDVRDVAEAHVRAAYRPETAGRYIVSGHNSSFPEMAKVLLGQFPNYPFPKRIAPKFLIWLFGPFINAGLTRKYVQRNVGWPWRGDNQKSIQELGMSYRPIDETLGEHFQQIIDAGGLRK